MNSIPSYPPEGREETSTLTQSEALTICTIVARNYLAQARCLVDSFLKYHPHGRAFVLLVDRLEEEVSDEGENFAIIPVEALQIEGFEAFCFRYTLLEFSTAVKPFFFEHLFQKYQLDKLLYFDPDILICGPLDRLAQELDSHCIILTPHLLDFLDDGYYPDELDILHSGAYNLGFLGLSKQDDLWRFIAWWQRKLYNYCIDDKNLRLFVDQRWIDLVPSLFDSVGIIRDPCYNVAYWNLSQRPITRDRQGYLINGSLLRFFHFSGFSPDNPKQISRHQNRLSLNDIPELEPLFLEYRDALDNHGYRRVFRQPNAYSFFDNGVAIPDSGRRIYRDVDPQGLRWPNPFSTIGTEGFIHWLRRPVTALSKGTLPYNNLALQVYREREDLQRAFPDVQGRDSLTYAAWFSAKAEMEHGLDKCFVTSSPDYGISLESYSRENRPRQTIYEKTSRLLKSECNKISTRLLRSFVLFAFRVNNKPGTGRVFKRLVGRSQSMLLKRKLLRAAGQPGALLPSTKPHLENTSFEPVSSPSAKAWAQGVNVVGYLNSKSGIGEIVRGTVRALSHVGFPFACTSVEINDRARVYDDLIPQTPTGHPHTVNLLHVNADQVPLVSATLGSDFLSQRRNIGYWFWEMSTFPEKWHDCFDLFDEIWVASSFTQSALADSSPVPVVRMRPCIHLGTRPLSPRSHFNLPEDRRIFLSCFDPMSIGERKNPFGFIEAFRKAFGSQSRRALLVLEVNQIDKISGFEANLGIDEAYTSELVNAVDSVSGVLINRYLSRDEQIGLMNTCDVFVSLHRSVGFGLSIAEAMALGKPTIATAYSSNMDFMTPANSFLVDYHLVELDRDYGPYTKGSVWADPDTDHAAHLMQSIVTTYEEATNRGALAAVDIEKSYGRKAVGEAIVHRLEKAVERKYDRIHLHRLGEC